jgi:HEAT repeat protein
MATGGTPLARVIVLLVLFAIPVLSISTDSTAWAQDSEAAKLLNDGLSQLRAGNSEAAVKTLRQALAADPSNEEVLGALGRAEYSALIGLLASGNQGSTVARALLDRAMPVLPERAFDEAELKSLVKQAVTDETYTNRFDAAMSLARSYGEFAVPYLVEYLASSNTDYKVNAHIALMSRISREAVHPLNEALGSDNADVRRMVAIQLGTIGDERSMAALAEISAGDANADVQTAAADALGKLTAKHTDAAGMGASELYLRLAQLYYAGSYRVMAYADRPLVLWYWQDGLKSQPVPRHLYVLKLAEEAAYDALRVAPDNTGARALLARIIASEKRVSDALAASMGGDELFDSYANGLASAGGVVASMGWPTLSQALGDSLDAGDQGAAAFLLDVMPHVYGGADFSTDHPVVRATMDANAGVRLAFNASSRLTSFPDPDSFMSLVARSAGEIVPRNVLVVDGNDERRNKMLSELDEAKYIGFDARTGSDGLVRAMRYPGLDLIVITTELVDMEPLHLIAKLKDSDTTKDIPVVIVGGPEQAADQEWRSLYEEKVAAITEIAAGPGLPSEAFRKAVGNSFGDRDLDGTARYGRSATILDAVATTDTDNALFNWNALTETLLNLISAADVPNDPPVRLNALRALANIGDVSALNGLVAFFGSDADGALRAAAGNAIAAICRKGPVVLEEAAFNTLLKGTADGDQGVRMAAFAALGSAALDAGQAVKVAAANRPGAAAGE